MRQSFTQRGGQQGWGQPQGSKGPRLWSILRGIPGKKEPSSFNVVVILIETSATNVKSVLFVIQILESSTTHVQTTHQDGLPSQHEGPVR